MSKRKCEATNAVGDPCGSYGLRESDPPRCFWHIAPDDKAFNDLRRAARGKGASVTNSQRSISSLLSDAGLPPALSRFLLRAAARGMTRDLELTR